MNYIASYLAPGLFQFDFNASSVQNSYTKIAEDVNSSFYDMQLGPDGKIYINGASTYDPVTYKSSYYMPAIKCPNLPKYACNYNATELTAPYGFGQLPNFINDYVTQPKAPRITEFSLGNDTSICFGTHKLSAPEGWQSYKWNTGEKTREITVSTPGLYYVLAGEEGFSCPSAFGSVKLKNAARQLDLGKDTVLCPNLTYTLQVPDNFSSLLWNDGTTVQKKVVTTGSTFSLIAQDANGCTNWDTIYIGFKSDPRANFGPDTVLCTSQSLLLQLKPTNDFAGPLATYLWQNASTKSSYTVTQPGTYWGRATYQGCTVSDTIHVDYVSAAGVSLGADTSLCTGDSLLLKTTISNAAYLWSTGETASSITVRSAGRYWVKVNNGSCVVMDTINVGFRAVPAVFLGNDTLLCDREKLMLLSGVQGASYLWQDGSAQSTFNAGSAGLYWVKATVNGCSKSDSIVVSYKPLPELNLGKDTGLCVQQTLLLNAAHSSVRSYAWQDGSTNPVYTVNRSGIYNVSVTGTNGCINKDTITVAFSPLPVFSLGNDTVLCEQQRLSVQFSLPDAKYNWSTGSTANAYTFTQPGLYWLDVAQNGCSKRDSISINYKPLPSVYLGNDTILCEGVTKMLDATYPGVTYQWQDMSSGPAYLVTKPGLYYASVALNGCIQKDSVQILYRYKPRFTLGGDTTLCTGQQLILHPSISNAALLWNNGSTAPSVIVQNTGTYILTATNECGSASDAIVISKGICRLFMPNAFTPNHDGANDLFKVKDPSFIKIFSMIIYNRWGKMVFKTDDPGTGWDGKYKGIDQPAGNFVWYITLTTKDGEVESAKGNVLLFR